MATSPRDGTVRLWRADGTPLAILDGCPGGVIHVLAWSPDGPRQAARSEDGALCLWQ